MSNHTVYLSNPEATFELGVFLAEKVSTPLLIALNGDLGAGKTALSQGIAAGFGVQEAVVSPTFTLANIYDSSRGTLYHLDIYRLPSLEDVYDLGLEDWFQQANSLILIEWQNKFQNWSIPIPILSIELKHQPPGRSITLDFPESCKLREGAFQQWQNKT